MEAVNANELFDVAVIGGGPAGLTAALYLARARYRVMVIEDRQIGGQITITSEVVNYPGVASASGAELTETMRRQAEAFGAEFISAKALKLLTSGDIKTVKTSKGDIRCFGILAATGANPRMIGFEGEKKFKGRGVAYCATCDGEFFTDKEVFVVGGGFAAAEEGVFLTKYAAHVTMLVREEDFTCAAAVAEEAKRSERITIHYQTEVESVSGDSMLRSIRYKNNATGEVTEYNAPNGDTFGVFVFAGYEPETALLKGIAELDERGYVITDSNRMTTAAGVYAAGDICQKNLRQVVTAVGDGAVAATELEKYAAAMQKKTGLTPSIPKRTRITQKEQAKESGENGGELFTSEMFSQLDSVFERMSGRLLLRLYTDSRPVSAELEKYMNALAERTDKLAVEKAADKLPESELPCVRIFSESGRDTGLAFHGVPGGHEFTSFVLGLYNAAGPGQPTDERDRADIEGISEEIRLKILVSLSCTMCPELVTSAQRIAAINPKVSAEVYDIRHFPEIKDKYRVMSVPCLIINEEKVIFGKKNLRRLIDIIKEL